MKQATAERDTAQVHADIDKRQLSPRLPGRTKAVISDNSRLLLFTTEDNMSVPFPTYADLEGNDCFALGLLKSAHGLATAAPARSAIARAAETILLYLPGKEPPATEPHPGYEFIEIDGIECQIGWIETNDDSFFNVIRHGCEIGKGYTRERAIDDAYESLTEPNTWLRGPGIPA